MATQPTNNSVPSESPRDLKFNAGKIDQFVTSRERNYTDRLGGQHYTIEGLKSLAQEAIASFGWILISSFQMGATITLPNQALKDDVSEEYYRWDGDLPKVIPVGSTPETTGGIGVGKWMSVGDAVLRTELKNGFEDILIEQPKSKNFWIDVHPDAKIHRINDRVLFGAASDNDGEITSERNPANKDWLELTRSSTTNNSQVTALSTIGQGALVGASRTSDSGIAGSMGCIGVQGWAVNDNTENVQTAYGAYFEVRRSAGAGVTHGFELDVVNFGTVVSIQPYNMFQQGLTAGMWLASGGEYTTNRASAAIAITNNGSTWDKGIIFHSTSLEGTNGITGSGTAMEMAKGHVVRWMFGSGNLGATISSSVSADASSQRLLFADIGFLIQNSNNASMLQVDVSSGFVNGLKVSPAAAGIGPTLTAQGSDTNIDLRLASKGNGLVDFRGVTAVATAGSQVGYVVLKFNGSSLKVPVYNS